MIPNHGHISQVFIQILPVQDMFDRVTRMASFFPGTHLRGFSLTYQSSRVEFSNIYSFSLSQEFVSFVD